MQTEEPKNNNKNENIRNNKPNFPINPTNLNLNLNPTNLNLNPTTPFNSTLFTEDKSFPKNMFQNMKPNAGFDFDFSQMNNLTNFCNMQNSKYMNNLIPNISNEKTNQNLNSGPDEKNTNFLENLKLNNNNNPIESPKITKKVTFRKKGIKMKPIQNKEETIKVIPFIINNLESYLMNIPNGDCEEFVDCDQIFSNMTTQNTLVGHKRTKSFYKHNKNLKV